jgi:L-threonine kinase
LSAPATHFKVDMIPTSFATLPTLQTPPLPMGVGRAFGTCGELVQGQFDSGEDFLITLPVDMWSEVRVTIDVISSEVRGNVEKTKTSLAIRKALDYFGFPNFGATFQSQSDLPEGKGMASSSADIVAACRAVSAALNLPILAEDISRIAISIEPTDGVMHEGSVCYNHREGSLLETLGKLPPANLLVLDFGNQIDTVAFNQTPKNYTAVERKQINRAYELIRTGIQMQDFAQIGLGATLSAEVNQRILPKPYFEKITRIAREHNANGLCAAHSGTVLGLLFARRASHRISAARHSILSDVDRNIKLFETQTL